MMRKFLVVMAVSTALTVAAFAASSNSRKSTVTVGDFAVKVTRAIGQPVSDRSAAVQSLKTRGVEIGEPNANLTEGMAAKILADLGLRVSTTSPDSAVTLGKADQLATMVGLASSAASVAPADGLPTQCLQLRNRGQCDTCCTTALHCDVDSTPCAGGACSKFCKIIKPGPPSPTDP
jgi:hypothetical protein